ncbi:hypothetical protein BXZ70DRAFT_1063314 [Cristinia sonorae]|uniref:TM7S3/TM198-like domain-containing protein n=1 Tax=Cristinia sonorae TaxID=1940300 RepID=A0A8K0XRH6_9AGAR|nr:hypothetical protein BXZ70DRAFT_1063314 [Cristinia sonorae]
MLARHGLWSLLLPLLAFVALVTAQTPTPTPNPSTNLTTTTYVIATTSTAVVVQTTVSAGRNVTFSTTIPVVLNVTATATIPVTVNETATPTPEPIHLETKVDPGFGVLGALLILTGLPSAFLGHKNRWSSFFLIGFYTLSLVCLVLILKFGVLPSVNPPSTTVRGLFVLACTVAGVAGGGIAIFFWKAAKYFIGAWGGLAFGWWIQCFRDGGLIHPVGLRWLMYIGCAAVGFILCTIPKLHYIILLLATAFVGATSFMLGVDCYTTAGLKEFYLWNLGFESLFPKWTENGIRFPVSQTMQIELGLLGATALMGAAVQVQILKILRRKLKEIQEEQRRRDEAAVAEAAERFTSLDREKEEWEAAHPGLGKHGRNDSGMTGTTLLKDGRDLESGDEKRGSVFTLVGSPRQRNVSGVSDFFAAATPTEDLDRWASKQSAGALPVLDLGADIEKDVPQNFMAEGVTVSSSKEGLEELRKKEELLTEIQEIRRSIDILKSESPGPSSSDGSRRPSMTSRRTLSHDLGTLAPAPSHLRPPRAIDPRGRVQSMELSRAVDMGSSINRPTSTPLSDNWDSYVRDRKLLQPPSGVSPPIPTTPLNPITRSPVSPAVAEALLQRQRRESSLSFGGINAVTPTELQRRDTDVAEIPATGDRLAHPRPQSQVVNTPVTILPPRKNIAAPTPKRPEAPRTKTFEELAERHREKIREMQAPLTRAEKEQADLEAAKNRWERAKEMEKLAVTKRQAEQSAAVNKEKKKRQSADYKERSGSPPAADEHGKRHTRSLSADVLATLPGASASSRRLSTFKVDEWQKSRLQEPEPEVKPASKRRSEVPFPDSAQPQNSRNSRRMSGLPRDPTR